jgi:hypothetical protein
MVFLFLLMPLNLSNSQQRLLVLRFPCEAQRVIFVKHISTILSSANFVLVGAHLRDFLVTASSGLQQMGQSEWLSQLLEPRASMIKYWLEKFRKWVTVLIRDVFGW